MAGGSFGEQRGEGFLLLLELVELHLDQLVVLEGNVEARDEFRAEAMFAELDSIKQKALKLVGAD